MVHDRMHFFGLLLPLFTFFPAPTLSRPIRKCFNRTLLTVPTVFQVHSSLRTARYIRGE